MDHKIYLKDPYEFLSTNMFIDLSDQLCQDKENDMFDWEILNNYATRILDTNTNKLTLTELLPTKNI